MIYALHGFLGRPEDWEGVFGAGQARCPDLFVLDEIKNGLWGWSERFNAAVQRESCTPRILCGYSLGGRLALHALLAAPDLWDAAIILSAHPGLACSSERLERCASDKIWAARFRNEPWEGVLAAWDSQKIFTHDPPNKSRLEVAFDREALAAVFEHWSLGLQDDLRPSLAALDLPILFVTGALDAAYSSLGASLRLRSKTSRCLSLPLAGHRLLCNNALNKPIAPFIEEILSCKL